MKMLMYTALKERNTAEIVRLITAGYPVNNPFDIDEPRVYNDTPLMVAAKYGYTEAVATLLKYGANVNLANVGTGMTALHQTCSHKHYETARVLISYGAQVNYSDFIYETPILEAVYCKSVELVKLLVYNGTEFSQPVNSAHDNTALVALATKQFEIMQFLIAAGTDVNYKNNFGEDLLSVLQDTSRDIEYLVRMYDYLLDAGCSVTRRHFNNIRLRQIRKRIVYAYAQPLSLLKLCRKCIRYQMVKATHGLCILESLNQLPLPRSLTNYLTFDIPFEGQYKVAKEELGGTAALY